MFDLNRKSIKKSTQFGLVVTLIVLLAACSHKPVQVDVVSAMPGPTPDVEDSAPAAPVWPEAKKSSHGTKHGKRHHKTIASRRSVKPIAAIGSVEKEIQMPPKSDLTPVLPTNQLEAARGGLSDGSNVEEPSLVSGGTDTWKLVIVGAFVALFVYLGVRATRSGKFGSRRRRLTFNS